MIIYNKDWHNLCQKAIVNKQKSFETNFGKMVSLVDLGLVPNS